MRKLLSLIFLIILLNTKVIGATANCSGGECEITNSYHYKFAKTNCFQTLNFEEIKTDYLYFIIINTDQRCSVFDSE